MKSFDATVLDRLFDPLGRILSVEVARKLADYRFDAKAQARIEKLARKCNDGKLTQDERREYETYVQTIDFIAILQAKARAVLARSPDA
jgi:protein-L-isoaspartate O-methyltransferase